MQVLHQLHFFIVGGLVVVAVCICLSLIWLLRGNLRSGVLFSEERESIATRESAFFFLAFPDRHSRVAILSRSSEKRTPDRRSFMRNSRWFCGRRRGVARIFQRGGGGGVTLYQTLSSWRFRHGILWVVCLKIKGLQSGGHGHPRTPPPLATPLRRYVMEGFSQNNSVCIGLKIEELVDCCVICYYICDALVTFPFW